MVEDPYALLAGRYPLALPVVRNGRPYPAAARPWTATRAAPGLAGAVRFESAVVTPDPGLRAAGQPHMQEVIATHPRTFDGPVAALRHRDGDQLVVAAGTYFDMLATCESLAAEWRADPRRTPLRDWADELAGGDPVATGRGRVAAVGVSLAVTVTREGVRRLLLGRRSAAVATDGGRWHVVPSGMLEPTSAGEPLLDTMLRELAEETGIGPVEQPRLLGLGFDLLRLRPEVCLHVEIGDGPAGVTGGEFDRDELVPLDWTDLWRRFGPDQLTPAAAATLALLEDQMG